MAWTRDPIFIFVLFGAALAVLHGTRDAKSTSTIDRRVVVSEADVAWIVEGFEKRWFRPPTQAERNALVRNHIKNEVLYREAVKLGLDKEDTALRRRVAMKLESLARDIGAAQPTDAELQAFLDENADRYATQALRSFEQVYVSTDKRKAAAKGDAGALLQALRGNPDQDLTRVGDMLPLEIRHPLIRAADVRAQFGDEFAKAVFALPVGSWQGPVQSGYGLHLVRVLESKAAEPPKLGEVRMQVQRDLMLQRKDEARDAFVDALLEKYDVVVESDLVTLDEAKE